LYSATPANVALWGAAPVNSATYNTSAGDPNSKSVTVSFVDVGTGDLHLTGSSFGDANLNATPVAGITVDYDNDARSATTPKMGADEPLCAATTITTQPQPQSICIGGQLNLSVVATGTSLTFQWRKDGTNIPGATSATYSVATAAASDAGSYDVVISSTCGNATSNAVAVAVSAGPSITTQPAAQTVCNGANATFNVAATGTGLTDQWQLNNTNVTTGTGGTTNSYSVPASAATAGNYTVIISNGSCATTSAAAALTLNAPTAITTQPASVTACQGNATFTVAATGAGLTYQWRFNGTNIPGATASTLSVPVTAVAGGAYSVVVTGTCGNVTSGNATLTVQNCTSVPNVDADITSMTMMPNLVKDATTLRVVAARTMKLNWNVVDAQGKVVMTISRQVMTGKNDIALYLGQLANGTYHLQGTTDKGITSVIRFVKH
ncbi:MAG: T9SS type A sorting domain-containing protein, partial [Sphingobacteriales bacterium]